MKETVRMLVYYCSYDSDFGFAYSLILNFQIESRSFRVECIH